MSCIKVGVYIIKTGEICLNSNLVSVVIPTHNRPFYLKRAIDSVLKQDYKNIEIIVVVDGSSKETEQMVNELINLTATTISIVQTVKKVGGSEARNIGAHNSKGNYIALLDDDDEWYADKISSQLELIRKNEFTDKDDFICFTSLHRYKNTDQKELDKLPNINFEDSKVATMAEYLFGTKRLRNIGFVQTSSILVPKRLLIKVPFTKDLPKHQDWDWLLKLDRETNLNVLQVIEPKLIYHFDVPKEIRTGYINKWRFTEKWGLTYKNDFSREAYESFILNYVLLGIANDNSMSVRSRIINIVVRFNKLSWRTKFRPYTWKMVVYMLMNK